MGLFKPAWINKNPNRALKAVGKMKDQSELAEVVLGSPNLYVQKAALAKLYYQELLVDVAKNSQNSEIRLMATEKIRDQSLVQEVYIDIAKNHLHDHIRLEIAEKVTDQSLVQEVYLDIVKNGYDGELRMKAAVKVTDQSLAQGIYAGVAKNGSRDDSKQAIDKLTNQALLVDVAKNAISYENRLLAAEKVTDQSLVQGIYAGIAKNESRDDSKQAIDKLTNQALLVDVAKNAIFYENRLLAAEKVMDQSLVQDLYAEIYSEFIKKIRVETAAFKDRRKVSRYYKDLTMIATRYPWVLRPYWKDVLSAIVDGHSDVAAVTVHHDTGGDCITHTDHKPHPHRDAIIPGGGGYTFPPYPYND